MAQEELVITIEDHNYASASSDHPRLRQLLSYQSKQFLKRRGQRQGEWKIEKHCIMELDGRFLAGLVPYVQRNIPCRVEDCRTFPEFDFTVPELSGMELREYQVTYFIEAIKQTRAIIKAPTGSGKTAMMAAMIAAYPFQTMVLAPNKSVAAQHLTELSKMLPRKTFSLLMPSGYDEKVDVVIGLARTFHMLTDPELERFQLILADECHQTAAKQALDVVMRTNAPYKYGFSATPTGRSDNRDIFVQGLFGDIIELVEADELRQEGYLANIQTSVFHSNFEGDWAAMEDILIVQNYKRNAHISQIVRMYLGRLASKEAILVLVNRREHGQILQRMIPGSEYVDGDVDMKTRELIRQSVIDGLIQVVIATRVFAQGIDIPNLVVGFNAAGGKAEILSHQKFGRVSRPYGGKLKHWIDLFDTFSHTLERHSYARHGIYAGQSTNLTYFNFPSNKQEDLEREARRIQQKKENK